jgi:beta-glucanase (GH16 family)/lysophospholipase L1-like esterase
MKLIVPITPLIDSTAPAIPGTPPILGLGGPAPAPSPTPTPAPAPSVRQPPTASAHIYVATTGNDTTGNGTSGNPYATITKAASVVSSGTSTVIHVAAGNYNGSITTNVNGTSGNLITYYSTTLYGAKIVASGSNSSAWQNNGAYTVIDGFEVDGSASSVWRMGLYITGSNSVVQNCYVHNVGAWIPSNNSNGGAGILADGFFNGVNFTIQRNIVRDIGPAVSNFVHGIYMSSTGDVKNNLIYNCTKNGITGWHNDRNNKYIYNTIANCQFGIAYGGGDYYTTTPSFSGPTDNVVVANNIIYNCSVQGINQSGDIGSNNITTNNLIFNCPTRYALITGSYSNDIDADPLFNSSSNFHLQATSPALNAANAAYAETLDLELYGRPYSSGYDLGCYEYQQPAVSTTPSPSTFTANVFTAPSEGSVISGLVTITVTGSGIYNVELLPETGYTPIYARLNVSSDHTSATIQWDTSQQQDGTGRFRLSAFNTPPNVQAGVIELIAMSPRTWTIANQTTAPSPTPTVDPFSIIVGYYGDGSIIGANGGTGPNPVTYPVPLQLATAYTGLTVQNKGVAGAKTGDFINGTNGVTNNWSTEMSTSTATHVIVSTAVNDWNISDDAFVNNYRALYAGAKAQDKVFIFETPHPTYQAESGGVSPASDLQVQQRAQLLINLANELGAPIIDNFNFINSWLIANGHTYSTGVADGLAMADTFCPDGLHPDQSGYDKISENVVNRFGLITGLSTTTTSTGVWPYKRNSSGFSAQSFSDEFNIGSVPSSSTWTDHIWWSSSDATVNYDISNGSARIWPVLNGSSAFFRRIFESSSAVGYGYYEWDMLMPTGRGWKAQVGLVSPNAHQISMSFYTDQGAYSNSSRHPVTFAASIYNAPTDTFQLDDLLDTEVNTDLSLSWHKYAIEWLPDQVNWFFDGTLVKHFAISLSDSPMRVFFGSMPDETTPPNGTNLTTGSSNSLQVNYIRSWSNVNNAASLPATSTPSPAPSPTPAPSSSSVMPTLSPSVTSGYTLTFQDEFNGSALDTSKWTNHIWYAGSDSNINYQVSNGALNIYPASNFIDRHIVTQGKFEQTYGFFEARLKMPIGHGCWPAFWLLNSDNGATTGAEPEIDIMECYPGDETGYWADTNNHPIRFEATYFQDGAGQGGAEQSYPYSTTDLSAAYHVYGLKWEANKLTYYFDGVAFATATISMPKKMYLLLSLQFQSWSASGPGDGTTPLGITNSYSVDYVRAWQFGNSTPSPTPSPTPAPSNGYPSIAGPTSSNFKTVPTFFDDFNGTQLSNKWNAGLWYHSAPPSNTWRVNNSYLEMCLQPDSMFTGANDTGYISFDTDPNGKGQGSFAQKYGCFQVRAKLAAGQGAWSAFWLFNHLDNMRPEIDIFECYPGGPGDWTLGSNPPKPNRADWTVHPNDQNDNVLATTGNAHLIDSMDLSAAFHIYTVEWDASFMKFYVDGTLVSTFNNSGTMSFFQQWPLYIILSLGVNYATSGGPSSSSTVTPTGFGTNPPSTPAAQVFSVDYVAVWQYNKY